MLIGRNLRRRRAIVLALAAATVVALAGCARANPTTTTTPVAGRPAGSLPSSKPAPPGSVTVGSASSLSKVLIIPEENETESGILNSGDAPYLTAMSKIYGTATNFNAGYPTDCPSLAAYIIMTSGSQQGICDDNPPSAHPISGSSIFEQLQTAGLQWRMYAEHMSTNCQATDSDDKIYLVRHAPAPYYTDIAANCAKWDVPLGTTTSGALVSDLATGLQPYSFVTPDACDDMHSAPSCTTNLVQNGDSWLKTWLPIIMNGTDYVHNRLVIIITWDEGSATSNHIPEFVISPETTGISSDGAFTHCSNLGLAEQVIGLPLLNCAASAPSMVSAFKL